jgi:hypothetical protein
MTDYELESRAMAVDRIAEQFREFVVNHIPGRLVVTRERLYGKPSINTVVFRTVGGGPLARSQQRVEINAEPVPGGWAYARSPQDLMRA